jgi:hypothetical protein
MYRKVKKKKHKKSRKEEEGKEETTPPSCAKELTKVVINLRGNSTEYRYTECQAFHPVVRIGSPHPLTRKRALPPSPLEPRGGNKLTCRGGMGGPIPTMGQTGTLVLCILHVYSLYGYFHRKWVSSHFPPLPLGVSHNLINSGLFLVSGLKLRHIFLLEL